MREESVVVDTQGRFHACGLHLLQGSAQAWSLVLHEDVQAARLMPHWEIAIDDGFCSMHEMLRR